MWVLLLSLWHVLSFFRIETLAVEIGKNFLFFLIYKYMTCFPNIPGNINWNVLLCVRVVTVLINHRYFFQTLSLRLAPYIYNQVELYESSRRLLHNWICTSSVCVMHSHNFHRPQTSLVICFLFSLQQTVAICQSRLPVAQIYPLKNVNIFSGVRL